MDLKLQPKPEVEILPANTGIVSREQFFVKKKFEEINQYFFAGHLIREWRPKAELIYSQVPNEDAIQYEYDFNREVQNCFVEDYAEEVFLRTPPPCFVVFGKFERKVNELCEKLSAEYGSVLIQVDDIVNQVIKKNTDTSKFLDRILRLGVSITLNFILALVSYVAHTPEARHRGYVLSGLPCLPLSYDLSVEQQFHYLFTWDNKPTVFINVLFNDEDLIKERTNLRVDFTEDEKHKYFKFHSLYQLVPDEEEESDVDDDMLPIVEDPPPFEPDVNISPSRQWAQLPRDEESRVWHEFEEFDNVIRPVIELINSRVDPQYFITLDSRVRNEFEIVQARLKLLQVWKAPEAARFFPPANTDEFPGEDDEEEKIIENVENDLLKEVRDKPPQAGFLALFAEKTISPKFRWELSHYNYICPVSLREGEVVEGKTKFAVRFMKYIYFLRDEQALAKFMQNPRAFVLPIRPKPLCRFIILGYPFSGKTSLATALSTEFSIPLIDVRTILQNDLIRKKQAYEEFCRQKAECREIIRLTTQAWQDWRMEEERRINLIEEWILYIGTLLSKRIEQFYCTGSLDNIPSKISTSLKHQSVESTENIQMQAEDSIRSGESSRREEQVQSLELHGTPIEVPRPAPANQSTPSGKLVQAMKHEDFDFNKNGTEVEANLFFSSLWNTFSGKECNIEKVTRQRTELGEDEEGQFDVDEETDEEITVDWCNLLPPQSLSSLLMSRRNCTTQEKRQSFKIFLEAASKVYWEPSALKSEFAKWRLPCFMDIPLCEIFLNNPILLLKYMPEWLKERPLIPDPVDSSHPSVVEASRQAFLRARVVSIKQTPEEVGILVRDAIEKVEREGMRVTGEVISPGGWVVDNMSLDMEVWNKLACENVFADHVYVLIDSEPEYRRIFNTWWKQCGSESVLEESSGSIHSGTDFENTGIEKARSENYSMTVEKQMSDKLGEVRTLSTDYSDENNDVIRILLERVKEAQQGNVELDAIYRTLVYGNASLPEYLVQIPASKFSSREVNDRSEFNEKNEENFTDDNLSIQSFNTTFIWPIGKSPSSPKEYPTIWNIPLGGALETVTDKLLNYFKKKSEDLEKAQKKENIQCGLEFFYFFLTLPKQLGQIKHLLTDLGRDATLKEIEITGKTPEAVIAEVRNELMAPFIKKPRELEDFEIEEIKKSSPEEALNGSEELESDLEEEKEEEEDNDKQEDLRIFGESGQLCVVNLERDIFLPGKLQHVLRYYGKLYYFWNEDAKSKFIEDPEKYAPYYSAIRCYPPLRLFVTGPVGSGKTTVAKCLSEQCGIPNVEYPVFLLRRLVPHSSFIYPDLVTDQKLLLSEEHNAAAKKSKDLFMMAPVDTRKFWMEQSLFSDCLEKVTKEVMSVQHQEAPLQPVAPFTYLCVESISEEESQDEYSELSKSEPLLPQTPYASMEEIETIITNYLTNNSDLNDYCIEKSFKTLWTECPYITEGFVLESFPMRSYDVNVIIENNWIPDLVIELVVPESEVIERNIDDLMELWDTKLKRETVEERLLEDTLISIQKTWIFTRKTELIKEKRKALEEREIPEENWRQESFGNQRHESVDSGGKKGSSKTLVKNFSSISNGLESNLAESGILDLEEEIEEIINEECPPLEFNPIFETYDAGKARIIENIISTYRKDAGEIEKLKPALKEAGVPWLEIDGLKSLDEILPNLFKKVDQIRKRITYKGEFAFTLATEMAEKLLLQGYYFLSKFGRWCPVQVYRMRNPIHMFIPFTQREKVTPIAYRNYIYFVAGEYEKKQFLEDPIKYTFNEPHHPNIPLRVAVIGPPKSGKSTLCGRLGSMFGLKVITMGSALRFALERTATSTLAKLINSYLRRGCFLPLSLKLEALMLCLNEPSCHTQGFVLDGIPFDAALTQSLAEKGKLPFVIISLKADSHFGKTNRERLDVNGCRIPHKNRTNLDTRYQDWHETYERFAQWNQNTYNNLYEVNAKSNVVDIFYQAYDIIRKSFFGILYYVEYCVSSRVLPLQYLCISQHEYELRKSSFHNNCPVCWAEKNRLNSSTDPPPRSGLVQYGNHFYWICEEDKQKFIENPKIYFFPHAPKCPEVLPKRLQMNSASHPKMIIHGNGRCPVTRTDFPDDLDWEGYWNHAALYDGKVYLCKNEEMLDRFLRQPWRYHKADTLFEVGRPTKSRAVENLGPPKIASLPPIGFLEQTVADLIHDSLQLLGSVRPIYPNMSPSVTGCIFVALYLKAHNKKSKAPQLETQYLNFMLKTCKAFSYKVSFIRPAKKEIGQGDFEVQESETSIDSEDSDDNETESTERSINNLIDFGKNEKTMWSAKKISSKFTEMKLTESDELLEIPPRPKSITVLKYEIQNMRGSPVPPVLKCLNFIYSVRPPLQLPEKFNFRTLYQPVSSDPSPVTLEIMYNPDKAFAISLFEREKSGFKSYPNLYKGLRTISDIRMGEYRVSGNVEHSMEYMKKRFIPRFKLHDKVTPTVPALPQTVAEVPLSYHPHRDYAYTVLLSEYFHTTHILKFYEGNKPPQLLEFSNRVDKTLELTTAQIEYFHKPKVTASEKSRTSLDSYVQIFDAASLFVVGDPEIQTTCKSAQRLHEKPSIYIFIQSLLYEKIEELFEDMNYSSLSYDSFDFIVEPLRGKPSVVLSEVLPYPPLPWDIISRPYHAFRCLSTIFKKPSLENIAHERHFSLLDGITESTCFRFLQIPNVGDAGEGQKTLPEGSTPTANKRKHPPYVFYDFFNLPWSAFLPYPFSATYNQEIVKCWPAENSFDEFGDQKNKTLQ